MHMQLRYAFGVIGLLATVNACADRVVAPELSGVQVRASRNEEFSQGFGTAAAHGRTGSPYYCSMSRLVHGKADRYEYGTVLLKLTRAELSADGAVAIYNVISVGGGGEVVGRAMCQIPDTDAARRHVNRLFHARSGPSLGSRGTISTQSEIEGVTGYACRYGGSYPNCNYEPSFLPPWQKTQVECGAMDPGCGAGGSSGGGDTWSWGGDDGDGSDPSPPDDPPDDDLRPPCRRDAQGYCVPENPDDEEWRKLLEAIAGIQENNDACTGAKHYLQKLASNGRGASLKMWSGYDLVEGTQYYGANRFTAAGARFIQWDRDWVFRELPLVVHEGLHAYFSLLASNSGVEQSSEQFADRYEETCGYTYSAEWKASGR